MSLVLSHVEEARARVGRIRAHVEDIKLEIVAAWKQRDWQVLGYSSWDEYCQSEFGGGIAIPKSEREDLVFTLRDAGMSYRAIEAATDMSRDTAQKAVSGVRFLTPERSVDSDGISDPTPWKPSEQPTVTGKDGKTYRATRPGQAPRTNSTSTSSVTQAQNLDDEIVDGEIVEEKPIQKYAFITEVHIHHDATDQAAAEQWARRTAQFLTKHGYACVRVNTRVVR